MKNNNAFTLAEVLITLVVIGVIAAAVIPILQQNINERVNSSRQANIAFKVTQAMDKMKALGLLEKDYGTTEAFVNELQKHLFYSLSEGRRGSGRGLNIRFYV